MADVDMENIANSLLGFGVQALPITKVLPIIALILAVVIYLKFRVSTDGTCRSFALFSVGFLAVSIIAGLLGVGIGVKYFCTYTQSSFCRLGGLFFSGPAAFSMASAMYLFYR